MIDILIIIGLFVLVVCSVFIGVFSALWIWSYVSIVYVKKIQDKFKMKQDEKRKEVK